MEFRFGCFKTSQGWNIYRIKNALVDYHLVPKRIQSVHKLSDSIKSMVYRHTRRIGVNQKRCHFNEFISLPGDIEYLFRNGRMYLGEIRLYTTNTHRQFVNESKMIKERQQLIRKLSFNHDFDNAGAFVNLFKTIFSGIEEFTQIDFFYDYVKREHVDEFKRLEPQSIGNLFR